MSSIVEFVADKAEHGFQVRSDIAELDAAIAFSRELYGFGDVASFAMDASSMLSDDDEDEDNEDENVDVDVMATLDRSQEHSIPPARVGP